MIAKEDRQRIDLPTEYDYDKIRNSRIYELAFKTKGPDYNFYEDLFTLFIHIKRNDGKKQFKRLYRLTYNVITGVSIDSANFNVLLDLLEDEVNKCDQDRSVSEYSHNRIKDFVVTHNITSININNKVDDIIYAFSKIQDFTKAEFPEYFEDTKAFILKSDAPFKSIIPLINYIMLKFRWYCVTGNYKIGL